MKYIQLIVLTTLFLLQPVVNPDNVKPGEWFTPIITDKAKIEADRQYNCRVLFERTGLECKE